MACSITVECEPESLVTDEARLPRGWANARLGDFTTIIGGSTPPRADPSNFGGDVVWLTPTEIPKDTVSIIVDSKEKLTEKGLRTGGIRWIPKASVLLTSRASIGYVGIAGTPVTTNQGFASFIVPDGIGAKYLGWWLRSQKEELENQAKGTTFKEISKSALKEIVAPIAPTNEQRRIVAAIEEQFTRLDAGVAALERARANLKRYRASVLKAAVEGRLTEGWRAEHPHAEPADALLERILTERRARWEEAELARYEKAGKTPPKGWQSKYKEPARPDTSDLPGLPEGWVWTSLDTFTSYIQAGHSFKCEERPPRRDEVGVVKVSAVTWGEYNELESKTCLDVRRFDPDLLVKPGDFLFSRANTIELVGACVIAKQVSLPNMLSDKILRLTFASVSPAWALIALRSRHGRNEIERLATGNQESMRNISQDNIRRLRTALPPLREQEEIVAEVERRLSVVEQVEAQVKAGLKRAARLRQSILKRAFEGRLVPQDPTDEPAGVSVERVQSDRK